MILFRLRVVLGFLFSVATVFIQHENAHAASASMYNAEATAVSEPQQPTSLWFRRIAATTGIAVADATAPAANQVSGAVFYS